MTRQLSSLNCYNWVSSTFEYNFITDTKNQILVSFTDCTDQIGEILKNSKLYSLAIENRLHNNNRRTNESDEKTRNTIILILNDFLSKNDNIILFSVLESTDGRERARKRLFYNSWYNLFGKDLCDMEQLPVMEIDSTSIISFLIFPKNFSRKQEILQFMQDYIQDSFD